MKLLESCSWTGTPVSITGDEVLGGDEATAVGRDNSLGIVVCIPLISVRT